MKHTPREIRWSIYCLIVLIVMNVVSLIILLTQNDAISQALITTWQELPGGSTDKIATVVHGILVRRNIFHVLIIISWTVLAYLVYKGWNWGRLALVVFTVLSFVGSIYAFSTTPYASLQTLAVLGWFGRIVLLWLLLVPRASREYFQGI